MSSANAAAPSFPGLQTVTVTSADTMLAIPDGGSLISLVNVEVAGTVVDVDVTVDVTHPTADHLDIVLVSPNLNPVVLTSDNGAQNDDVFAGTVFDDQATGTPSAPNVRNFTYTNLVATGTIQPEEALGSLIGEGSLGPWTLVVTDDTNGSTGQLRSWSLTVSYVPTGSLKPTAPLLLTSSDTPVNIPDNQQAGRSSSITVAGAGTRLLDVDVTVNAPHNSSGQLEFFLTGPDGRRVDLVTALGGGNDNLYVGTIFDDQAGDPLGDLPLPPNAEAFERVAGEGALSTFVGIDPNGTWTLTVADRGAGTTGSLAEWTLRLVTTGACGDGVQAEGEACEDGNTVDGDGCDSNCSPTGCGNGVVTTGEDCDDGNAVDGDQCPTSCVTQEHQCGDCADDDGNGLVDAADPACGAAALEVKRANVLAARGAGRGSLTLTLNGALPSTPSAPLVFQLSDANGSVACLNLGKPRRQGKRWAAGALGYSAFLDPKHGRISIRGKRLNLSALDDPAVTVGLLVGTQSFAGQATLRTSGRRRVFP